MWVTLVQWAVGLLWLGPVGWVTGGGIPVFFGIPAVLLALWGKLSHPSQRITQFLAANICCGLFLATVGFLQPNPEPHLVLLGGAAIAGALLVFVGIHTVDNATKRSAAVDVALAMAFLSSYALPPTLPIASVLHLEGVLTVPGNTGGWTNLTGSDGGDRLQGFPPSTRTFTVNPGRYRVDLACAGYFEPVPKIVPVGVGASVTVSADCPPPPKISASTGKCGPFPNRLEPLDAGFNTLIGPPIGVEAFGCGPGQVPTDGSPFSVESGWTVSFAYSCNGTFGPTGNRPVIQLTAHDTLTGADLTPEVRYGVAGLGTVFYYHSPAGRYVIRVTLPYPDDNQCQWHLIVHRAR